MERESRRGTNEQRFRAIGDAVNMQGAELEELRGVVGQLLLLHGVEQAQLSEDEQRRLARLYNVMIALPEGRISNE